MPSVPRTREVIPGAHVNIVLKPDQRTGRQVQGTVQNVLTRGDHHRGIKVRLTDGRIGRVQSMALGVESGSSTQSYSGSMSTENPNAPVSMTSTLENHRGPRGQGYQPRYRDVRLDEPLDVAPEQIDLGAYIVPPKRKGRGKKRTNANANQAHDADSPKDDSNTNEYQSTTDITSAIAKCPVCGTFEGDETAVAHHVADHFGS